MSLDFGDHGSGHVPTLSALLDMDGVSLDLQEGDLLPAEKYSKFLPSLFAHEKGACA